MISAYLKGSIIVWLDWQHLLMYINGHSPAIDMSVDSQNESEGSRAQDKSSDMKGQKVMTSDYRLASPENTSFPMRKWETQFPPQTNNDDNNNENVPLRGTTARLSVYWK